MLTVDPSRRMTLAEVVQEPWMKTYVCPPLFRSASLLTIVWPSLRPSQIAGKGPVAVANQLTQSLKQNGDWQIAMPDLTK